MEVIIYIIIPLIIIVLGGICILFAKIETIKKLLKRPDTKSSNTKQMKFMSKLNTNLQSTVDNLVDKVKLLSAKVQLLEENKKIPITNDYKALMIRTLDGIKQINETILNEVSEKGYFIINSSPDEILYNSERAKDCNLQIEITPEDNHYVILFRKKKYDSK